MHVILFGATGMVGQGVLRECLRDAGVEQIISVVREASGQTGPKLEEIVHSDFHNFASIKERLGNLDACMFTLGVFLSRHE